MPSWTLHLVNARGQLASCADVILSACAEAEARVGAVTAPLALDIVIRATQAMPNWLGYTLGRRMVDRILARHPQHTALSLAAADAQMFRWTLAEAM